MQAQPPGVVGLSVVVIEEAFRGRLAALARARDGAMRIIQYGHLLTTAQTIRNLPLVPYDAPAEVQFQHLLTLRLRIGTQDLKIAAIALANQLTLLTRNRSDFGRVPGLALDDWSV
jgi:tRNA(fMet)-specific endonuclease VapC